MGVKKITDYCISTDAGDLVFYIVRPSNLGVLPANAIMPESSSEKMC